MRQYVVALTCYTFIERFKRSKKLGENKNEKTYNFRNDIHSNGSAGFLLQCPFIKI